MDAVAYCAPHRTEYAELVLERAGLDAEIIEHPDLAGDTVYLTSLPAHGPDCPSARPLPQL